MGQEYAHQPVPEQENKGEQAGDSRIKIMALK
jgi:hypothetical protein